MTLRMQFARLQSRNICCRAVCAQLKYMSSNANIASLSLDSYSVTIVAVKRGLANDWLYKV